MPVFTKINLPPFIENSAGIAHPKPGASVAFVRCPALVIIQTPWGQSLRAHKGTAHIALDGEGDNYPNMEFDDFYEVGGVLSEEDPRAAYLLEFWRIRGYNNLVCREATKTRSAIVLGVVTQEAGGNGFLNHEGVAVLQEGSVILQSPDNANVVWAIQPDKFAKKYQPIQEV